MGRGQQRREGSLEVVSAQVSGDKKKLAAATSAVAAAERDLLLETKLYVPAARFRARPRLAERLDEGLGQGLMLVCAPAGPTFG